jgi:hypothetical protein
MRFGLVWVVIAACASPSYDPCLHDDLTLQSSGVYGRVWSSCELKGPCDSSMGFGPPVPGQRVGLFADERKPPDAAALVETTSNENGFYQLAIDAGTYNLYWIYDTTGINSHFTRVTLGATPARYDLIPGSLGSVGWSPIECVE